MLVYSKTLWHKEFIKRIYNIIEENSEFLICPDENGESNIQASLILPILQTRVTKSFDYETHNDAHFRGACFLRTNVFDWCNVSDFQKISQNMQREPIKLCLVQLHDLVALSFSFASSKFLSHETLQYQNLQ